MHQRSFGTRHLARAELRLDWLHGFLFVEADEVVARAEALGSNSAQRSGSDFSETTSRDSGSRTDDRFRSNVGLSV